jgi:hypothetical protein
MNERIRELAEQVGIRHDAWGRVDLDDFQYRKFAELIVRECCVIADEFEVYVNQGGLVDRIKEHFGVER